MSDRDDYRNQRDAERARDDQAWLELMLGLDTGNADNVIGQLTAHENRGQHVQASDWDSMWLVLRWIAIWIGRVAFVVVCAAFLTFFLNWAIDIYVDWQALLEQEVPR